MPTGSPGWPRSIDATSSTVPAPLPGPTATPFTDTYRERRMRRPIRKAYSPPFFNFFLILLFFSFYSSHFLLYSFWCWLHFPFQLYMWFEQRGKGKADTPTCRRGEGLLFRPATPVASRRSAPLRPRLQAAPRPCRPPAPLPTRKRPALSTSLLGASRRARNALTAPFSHETLKCQRQSTKMLAY